MKNNDIGSGHFGKWITDQFGLPAYSYTCQQYTDEKAIFPTNTMWKKRNDHYHQAGNDRIVGLASNYGYFQLRQDEGGPKFLNDYCPENNQFAGGFGYLTDNQNNILTTYYTKSQPDMKRIFGMGYFLKEVQSLNYHVRQTIFAPFGDCQYVISQVEITNQTNNIKNVKWTEYWGGQMYQMTYRPVSVATIKKECPGEAILFRREFEKNFSKHFSLTEHKNGMICESVFEGYHYPKNDILDIDEINQLVPPTCGDKSYEDLNPPRVFLICLSDKIVDFETDADAFFGKNGVEKPVSLLENYVCFQENPKNAALILSKNIELKPHETRVLSFAYGYLNKEDHLDDMIKDHQIDSKKVFKQTMMNWKKTHFDISVSQESWVQRETLWNYYYLRSGLTYDDYYQEHLLNQAGGYQYVMGFQGCPRDPLQHLLPFLFSDYSIAKEVIKFSLKLILPGGKIPMAISGKGCIFEEGFLPSDQELWYLWVVSEYIFVTRDYHFIDEIIHRPDNQYQPEKVIDILFELYQHLVDEIGLGEHHLVRMLKGDWSNSILRQNVSPSRMNDVQKTAESMTNSTMAVYALSRFAEMLELTSYKKKAQEVLEFKNEIENALKQIYNGKWYQRAFLASDLGWVGEDELWLEPQPWSIIGQVLSYDESQNLINQIKELLIDPSPIGAMKRNVSTNSHRKKTDGQVWWSINGTLIWALAKLNHQLAWEEWKKNSFVQHAHIYPDIWFGIWSGPDCYTSILSSRPGETRFSQSLVEKMNNDIDKINGTQDIMDYSFIDFPISNLHAHAWPLYSFIKLLGVEFTKTGLIISPVTHLPDFCFTTQLLHISQTSHCLKGYYAPLSKGEWEVQVNLKDWNIKTLTLLVNGQKTTYEIKDNHTIIFKINNNQSQQMNWAIYK